MNLGIAFQIIDDILDYTQDQPTIGKPAGNDLRQGMVTLPLIYALQSSSVNGHQRQVQMLLNGQEKDEQNILDVLNWVAHSDSIEQALVDAQIYADKAREAIHHFPTSPDRDLLDSLIDFVVERTH